MVILMYFIFNKGLFRWRGDHFIHFLIFYTKKNLSDDDVHRTSISTMDEQPEYALLPCLRTFEDL